MNRTIDPSSFWQRLQRNGEANTAVFIAAGLRPEVAGDVSCPACALVENALFWGCEERTEHFLHLRCPRCERGGVWYSLKKNAPIESFAKWSRVLCGTAAMLMVLAGGALAVQHSDLLPARLSVRLAAAKAAAATGRHHAEVSATTVAHRLERVANIAYERTLLLRDADDLTAMTTRPVLNHRARRWWRAVVTLGQG
jgi:hypothetical protein